MYTSTNFATKKAFKEAIANGRKISVFQPGPFGNGDYENGVFVIEGPHYPKPHTWYAKATVENGYVVRVV
jgi:hypothetical protein